ncbi:MAG: EamA family transporter [Eubacteriales bacterium]
MVHIKNTKILPICAGVVTAIIWGFSFIFTKDILNHTFPSQVIGLRFAFAVIALTVLKALGVIRIDIKSKGWKALIPLSLFQPGLYFIGETWGVKWTTASEAGMIIALVPVVSIVMAGIFLKEKVNFLQFICILTSIAGVFVIVTTRGELRFGEHLFGIMALFLAVIAQAAYSILSKRLSQRFTSVEITYIMMWSGMIIFNALGIIQSLAAGTLDTYLSPLRLPSVTIGIIYLGVISSVLAFFMFNYALAHLKISQTTTMLNLVTVVSVFGGVVFQNDPFGWLQVVGIVLILIGVWGTTIFSEKSQRDEGSFDISS